MPESLGFVVETLLIETPSCITGRYGPERSRLGGLLPANHMIQDAAWAKFFLLLLLLLRAGKAGLPIPLPLRKQWLRHLKEINRQYPEPLGLQSEEHTSLAQQLPEEIDSPNPEDGLPLFAGCFNRFMASRFRS